MRGAQQVNQVPLTRAIVVSSYYGPKTGIHTIWQDCPVRTDRKQSTPSCDDDLSKLVLYVYLVERLERTLSSVTLV
jgi:hypothetical protein